ncbi:TPA: hypothetical protein ACH3X1_010930 [Trebouxia sp. C0004]
MNMLSVVQKSFLKPACPLALTACSSAQDAILCFSIIANSLATTEHTVMGDFAWGQPRPNTVSTSSQHASETCSAAADGMTIQPAVQPAVSYKPSQRQPAEEKVSGTEQSASDIHTHPTRHRDVDAANTTSSTSLTARDPQATTAPVKGATVASRHAKATSAPDKGPSAPVHGATAATKSATAPATDAALPIKHATAAANIGAALAIETAPSSKSATASGRAAKAPIKLLTVVKEAKDTTAVVVSTAPMKGATVPVKGANARGARERNTQASALNIASTSSATPDAPIHSPAAKTSSTSHDQAINAHSQLACMTRAVSSTQASMAPMQIPEPPVEQRHDANAECGQVSQVSQHSSQPPVRSQTAHLEPEQSAQAERQCRTQGGHQITAPSQISHLARAEPRQYVQAERDPLSKEGQHASRPLHRVRSVTAEPAHGAQAQHRSDHRAASQQADPTLALRQRASSPQRMIQPSVTPCQACTQGVRVGLTPVCHQPRQDWTKHVYRLADRLSNALQELLVTEDHPDFAQSIQALMSNNDDAHVLRCLLTASWHKLHGASWRPVTHSDIGRLHLASTKERVAAAREGLDRVFRKAGSLDPAVYSDKDSLQLGPAINPRKRLPFKLHYSNVGYQLILKQGWEEGKGLGHGEKGRADPYILTHQCGRDARLGLGCMRYKDILTGKGAEDEIRDAIIGLCSGPAAVFTMGALREAVVDFLTNLPQDSRASPVEGLTWIGGLLGGLVVKGALSRQQANTLVINAAASKASRGHMAMGQTGNRQHVMRGAIIVLAEHISPAELQRQLQAAGLPLQCMPAKAQPHKQQTRPAAARVVGGSWPQVAAG